MRYMVKTSFVDVLGRLWMGGVASLRIRLSDYDIRNIQDHSTDEGDKHGQINRAGLEQWLTSHSGDFQQVIDFSASIEAVANGKDRTFDFDWASEENAMQYLDTISETD